MELAYSGDCQLNRSAGGLGAGNAAPVSNRLDGTAATSQGVFIFFLNKNTLMLSPNGIDLRR